MPVRGLERDEAVDDSMTVEAERKPPVGLSGRDREQPAVCLKGVQKLRNAFEQRLFDLPFGAGPLEVPLVAFGEEDVAVAALVRNQSGDRLDEAQSDDPAANVRRRHGEAMVAER